MTRRILVVDDAQGIVDVVRHALEKEGFLTETAADADSALAAAAADPFDLIVLDIMLPDRSGTDVLRQLRAEGNSVPVVMLTARDSELDRILGLEIGADDYVTKPFSSAELVSRIRAVLRRTELNPTDLTSTQTIGGVRIDYLRHEVEVDGQPVRITRSEFILLALLAEQPERVVTRRDIMQRLWSSDWVGDEHAADVHISNLRRKLERDPEHPQRIVTVRGFGYKLVPA